MIAAATPPDELERLDALHRSGVLDTAPEERFDRVTRLCRRLFGVDMAFVNLVDHDRLWSKSAVGLDRLDIPRETSVCAHTILEPEGIVVEDLTADERFVDSPFVVDDPNLRFYAGVPLAAPGGQRVGTLCIADRRPRTLSPADRAILRDMALWVEQELNLEEELGRAAQVQRALLPARPPSDDAWDVAAVCRPSRDVGGDFYDWHPAREGTVVALGDVMGKGMPAAIVMASVRSALRAGARSFDPGAALEHAARSLADDLARTATFASAFVACLSDDGHVTCSDAGHGQAVVVRETGETELLQAQGLPVGIDDSEHYLDVELDLRGDDLLLVHSDGLLELDGGPRTTEQAAALVVGATTAQDAVDRLMHLTGRGAPPDDVTVMAVRRKAHA
ncbi:SpoIIE family protein phosphatase [Patulibacter sp. SYSU D01012]|uniref:PP2C family protein-serine/threonine phosphatase n=1 Tax=Patulibacter sp. SYSU D01012 TaxID=2817381 RepID=UPI001B30AC4E|nr:SpoIIE family protein phosphatase [Patulibacter sp. SYSU D01012]